MKCQKSSVFFKSYPRRLLFILAVLAISLPVRSQMLVYPLQNFNFGSFFQGTDGGTVDISADGSRSASGGIVLINSGASYSQAIFEIDAAEGSILSVLNGPDITLYGSKGGSITLRLSNSDPASPFVTTAIPPARTVVRIGASLTIGNSSASPPGNYSGSFSITFHQE